MEPLIKDTLNLRPPVFNITAMHFCLQKRTLNLSTLDKMTQRVRYLEIPLYTLCTMVRLMKFYALYLELNIGHLVMFVCAG